MTVSRWSLWWIYGEIVLGLSFFVEPTRSDYSLKCHDRLVLFVDQDHVVGGYSVVVQARGNIQRSILSEHVLDKHTTMTLDSWSEDLRKHENNSSATIPEGIPGESSRMAHLCVMSSSFR